MKFGATDQDEGVEEYPKYLCDKYALLVSSSLKLPAEMPKDYTQISSTNLTVQVICEHLYFLINDYPHFFIRLVDEWIVFETENEQAKRLEDARFGTTYPSRSRMQRELHPRIKFERMVKDTLSEARKAFEGLSTSDRKWYLYTEAGQRKADRLCEVRHKEVESDDDSEDEMYWRDPCPSPSPAQKPPTPISNPTSPCKRSSDASRDSKNSKRSRTSVTPSPIPARSRCTTSEIFGSVPRRNRGITEMGISPLPTFPDFDFSRSPICDSPSFGSKPSLIISSTSAATSRIVTPPTPPEVDLDSSTHFNELDINDIYEDDDWQSIPSDLGDPHTPLNSGSPPFELNQSPEILDIPVADDDAWNPVPARPEGEQTVLVHPINQYQQLFWQRDIQFHVQWELQRRMAQQNIFDWDDLDVSDLVILQGSVAEAIPKIELVMQAGAQRAAWKQEDERGTHLTVSVLRAREKEISMILQSQPHTGSDAVRRMCTEADREERSIRAQDGKGSYSDDPNWKYGGKLIYTVYIRPVEKERKGRPAEDGRSRIGLHRQNETDSPTQLGFSMELRPPTMTGKSFHLARKYGSRRILNFKFADIKGPKARQEMFDLFEGRRFWLAGRVYRAWSAATDKSSCVAIEVNDSIPGLTIPRTIKRNDPPMPSFIEQLASSNDLTLKPGQAMAKWASRPQLLLSDSYPAVCLSPSEVEVIDDIVVEGLGGPASTEQTLTDGCGLMTEAVARQIGLRLPSSHGRPCVVQMRLMGAKGLLVLMTAEQEMLYSGKKVILRKSMVKSLTSTNDTSRNILEVVRCGHSVLKTRAGLPSEAIIALNSRGVPSQVLIDKAEVALEEIRKQFDPSPSGSETPSDVRLRLSAGFYQTGGVGVDRRKRACAEKALSLRVAGLIHDEQDKADLDATEQDDTPDLSGQPVQVAERAMMVVDAGFDPRRSAYACSLLHRHVDQQTLGLTRDFRIPLTQAMSAFIIPDSLGVLGPKEIFVAFSGEGPVDQITGCTLSHLSGPVLAFRSPCKLPTDVQRYTAVYRPELRHLKDCIVMSASSIECRQSPASFLAGGDYDGDTATIIFDPLLVEPFVQADDEIANIPASFEEQNFERELVKGDHFLEQLSGAGEEALIRNYQTFLLGAVMDDKITGMYSVMHDNAVYVHGHDDPKTVRLARMFSMVLDARKSGLQVKPEILKADTARFMGKLDWRSHKKGEVDDGEPCRVRPKRLGRFIMDELMNANIQKAQDVMRTFPKKVETPDRQDFDDLAALYKAKEKQVAIYDNATGAMKEQLQLVARHVNTCYDIWVQVRSGMTWKTHAIQDLYALVVEGQTLPSGSRTTINQSPTKARVVQSDNLAKAANMRDLAKLWHEGLCLEDVSGLCADTNELRRLMISCSAAKSKWAPKQIFPFDMDFPSTLQLKAEKVGKALTITSDAMLAKKPTWGAEKM